MLIKTDDNSTENQITTTALQTPGNWNTFPHIFLILYLLSFRSNYTNLLVKLITCPPLGPDEKLWIDLTWPVLLIFITRCVSSFWGPKGSHNVTGIPWMQERSRKPYCLELYCYSLQNGIFVCRELEW